MTDSLQGQTLGKYRIRSVLGTGASGAVYLADYDRHAVAIKVLDLAQSPSVEVIRRFHQEIDVAGRLRHPNIVRVFGGGQEGRYLYMAMEYVEGGSLKEYLVRQGGRPLPVADALRIALQLCSALEYAHGQKVVHRDVKPGNILLRRDGRAMLGDFGIARALTGPGAGREGRRLMGTPAYLSPEQALGDPATTRSDLYSLGAVLYEMLCGEQPYQADNEAAILYKHIHETPRRIADGSGYMPAAVLPIVRTAMAKESGRRYPDARAMGREIEKAMAQMGILPLAFPGGDVERAPISPPHWTGRSTSSWGLTAVIAGVVLALVLGGAIMVPQWVHPQPTATATARPRTSAVATTLPPPTTPPPLATRTRAVTAVPNLAQTRYAQETVTAAVVLTRSPTTKRVSPTVTVPSNRVPVVQGIQSDGSYLVTERVVMHVVASDPEKDPLTYRWYIKGLPPEMLAQCTSADCNFVPKDVELPAGAYTVYVDVSDGHGHAPVTVSRSLEIRDPTHPLCDIVHPGPCQGFFPSRMEV